MVYELLRTSTEYEEIPCFTVHIIFVWSLVFFLDSLFEVFVNDSMKFEIYSFDRNWDNYIVEIHKKLAWQYDGFWNILIFHYFVYMDKIH